MQRLEVSGAVRPIYGSLGVKRLINKQNVGNASDICRRHIFFLGRFDPLACQGLPLGASRSQLLDTPHSVGLLWTNDQPGLETSTWQNTTFTRDKQQCPGGFQLPKPQTPKTSNPAAADPSFDGSATAINNVYLLHEILKFSRFCFHPET